MHHGKTISFKNDSPRHFKIFLCGLSLAMASVCSAQVESKTATGDSQSGVSMSAKSEANLLERASLDPVKIVAKADTIKETRKRANQPIEDANIKALREKTQRALIKAGSDDEREIIITEFLAIQQAQQAKTRMDTLKSKSSNTAK
jgi:hypothetical protein